VSIGSILSIARTAMNAQQTVIQVAGHNIANAETEGFSRQRTTLTANTPEFWTYGTIGTGVSLEKIERLRDESLDASYRGESGDASAYRARADLLGGVEEILGEPSDDGLAASMDAFWGAWSDLSNSPSSAAARSVVQQRGAIVASTLNTFDVRLREVRDQVQLRLTNSVSDINTLADQVAALNGQIVSAEAGGKLANDLRDQRDVLIDNLAKLGDVRILPSADHSLQVLLGTSTIVDGAESRHLNLAREPNGDVSLRFDRSTEPMLPVGGTVTAMVDFLNKDLPDAQGRLDAMAAALASQVNTLHRQGQTFDAAGNATAAGDFFSPGEPDLANPPALLPVTAGSIRLSDAVAASPTAIAASKTVPGAGQVAGPGNNEVALALAGLRTAANTVSFTVSSGVPETGSFASFYREMTSRLGARVKDADSSATVHETLVDQSDHRRASVSGVNVDEELTTLMRAQQAYAAAAKVITTAQEMLKTLVEMV
jgi:flagellar hook-associated protein 1 FlgK